MGPNAVRGRVRQKLRLGAAADIKFTPFEREGTPKALPEDRINVAIPHCQVAGEPRGGISQTNVRVNGRTTSKLGGKVDQMIDVEEITKLSHDRLYFGLFFDD